MKKMQKTFYSLLCIVIIGLTVTLIIQDSLGRYRKQGGVDYRVSFSEWNILINDESLNDRDVLSQKLVPISVNDPYIADGAIAPGSIAYCDIVIDSSKVSLPFHYTLVPISEGSMIPDLLVKEYIINPSGTNNKKVEFGNAIEGDVAKDVDRTVIRIYVTWNDETGIMSNEEDTNVAINYEEYPINLSMSFKQLSDK